MNNSERFWVERLDNRTGPDKPGDAFAIKTATFSENGEKCGDVIINIISGSDRSEAERYAKHLNESANIFLTKSV